MDWIKIFSALSDETRLRIFLLLLRRELCVCELTNILEIEQSRVSHSLKELANAQIILNRRYGKWNIYFVNPKILKQKIFAAIKKEINVYDKDLKRMINCKIRMSYNSKNLNEEK